jgi:GNAT superfamily N-acetyltransferase
VLDLFFVDPEYQRQGIGSLLLEWGAKKADALKARIWITGTPQAVSTYERNGWKVVERYDIALEEYGGQGIYSQDWMLREPTMTA